MTLNLLPRLRLADFPFYWKMGLVERDAGLEGLASVDGWCFVGLKALMLIVCCGFLI
jgi:hypothetical protein